MEPYRYKFVSSLEPISLYELALEFFTNRGYHYKEGNKPFRAKFVGGTIWEYTEQTRHTLTMSIGGGNDKTVVDFVFAYSGFAMGSPSIGGYPRIKEVTERRKEGLESLVKSFKEFLAYKAGAVCSEIYLPSPPHPLESAIDAVLVVIAGIVTGIVILRIVILIHFFYYFFLTKP